MDPESLGAEIKRPQYLSRILDYQTERKIECMDVYKEFLNLAESSTKESISTNLAIAANYKLAGIPNVSEFVGYNDNLVKVFSFYAKIQQTHHTTFSSADLANETMNFKKFEIFCRDFKLIPKLLTREDIKMAWEMMAHDWVQAGKGTFVSIGFTEFKDILVRMALIAYHKPGLKKLILMLEGFMPQNVKIVACFCNYMHLHDIEYIANFIRTVGRKTQGDYNFKSKGDVTVSNSRTIMEILSDKEARKLSQIALTPAATSRPISAQNKQTKPKAAAVIDHMEIDHPLDKEHMHSFGGGGSGAEMARKDSADVIKKGYNAFGEKIIVPLEIRSANPHNVIREANSEQIEASAAARRALKSRFKTLPVALQGKLQGDDMVMLPPIVDPHTHGHGHDHSGHGHDHGHGHKHVQHADEQPQWDDHDSLGSSASSALPSIIDNSLECLKESLDRDYEPTLVKHLARYCYIPPKVVLSDTVYIGGPFVDLGLLTAGSKVTINLTITNSTADDVHIDATTRNMKSHDTDLKTFSKALIPGFTRSVQVTFTVEPGKKTVLAFIDIISIAVRRGENSCIACPVFYRVDSLEEKDHLPHCTSESLQDLLGQFCPGRDRRLVATFERQKIQGTWKTKSFSAAGTMGIGVSTALAKPRTIKVYTMHK